MIASERMVIEKRALNGTAAKMLFLLALYNKCEAGLSELKIEFYEFLMTLIFLLRPA